ncbi:MAG: hypothetical protein IT405_00705 [Candidatus Yanofskybacteria bacterium]|nr:hypothetical protein [Candidatus Yanofskybacteria bacterium]
MLQIPLDRQLWYLALFAWVVVWKGLALWRAAQKEQKWWFVVLLVINTLGILEILYVYVFSVERTKNRAEEAKTE